MMTAPKMMAWALCFLLPTAAAQWCTVHQSAWRGCCGYADDQCHSPSNCHEITDLLMVTHAPTMKHGQCPQDSSYLALPSDDPDCNITPDEWANAGELRDECCADSVCPHWLETVYLCSAGGFFPTRLRCDDPSCTDGEQNGHETGVDCGGPCEPCPPPPSTGGGTSCTGPEFMARSQAVTAACCDDAHPCESGLPTTCTAACAEHLLPMQRDCAAMVTTMGLADVISTAAAECPEPTTPCSTGPEFMAYSQMVCTHSTQSSAVSQTAPDYLWSHSMRSATRNLNDGACCVRVCRSPRPAATMHRPRAPRGSRRQHAARRARRCCCRCRQRADRS